MGSQNMLLKPPEWMVEETEAGTWRRFLWNNGRLYEEYTSHGMIWGMPLVHRVSGISPETGKRGVAKGFVAIGARAHGVIAIGQLARGRLAIGQCAYGEVAIGQLAIGRFAALGQLAIAPLAVGQFAIGAAAVAVFGVACWGLMVMGLDPEVVRNAIIKAVEMFI